MEASEKVHFVRSLHSNPLHTELRVARQLKSMSFARGRLPPSLADKDGGKMILEARSPSCFSNHYVLKFNGQAHGEYRGRWFSEGIDIRLSGRRRLHLHKESWLASHFNLADANGNVLAEANRSGLLTSSWNLALSTGAAQLVSAGFFNTGFNVVQSGQTTATANRVGMCEGGWFVEDQGAFTDTDLLLIGLIYHTILERRRSSD